MAIGSYQTNCYFVYREDSKKAVVIDPADNGAQIYSALERNGFTVEAILLTHGHFDHIWGSKELREVSGAKIYANSSLCCIVYQAMPSKRPQKTCAPPKTAKTNPHQSGAAKH